MSYCDHSMSGIHFKLPLSYNKIHTQLTIELLLLIKVKMSTIVCILTFISMINFMCSQVEHENIYNLEGWFLILLQQPSNTESLEPISQSSLVEQSVVATSSLKVLTSLIQMQQPNNTESLETVSLSSLVKLSVVATSSLKFLKTSCLLFRCSSQVTLRVKSLSLYHLW